jgi:hypothetical protein
MIGRRTAPVCLVAALAWGAAHAARPVPLVGGDVSPGRNLEEFGSVVPISGGRYRAHALVALPAGWTAKIDAQLRALGVVVLGHTYDRSFLARVNATPAQLQAALSDLGIEIAPIPAVRKIAPSFAAWKLDPRAAEPGGRIRALVRVHDDVTPAEAGRAFASAGVTARRSRRCPCFEVALTDAERDRLAREDAVSLIEPNDTKIRFLANHGRPAVGADALQGYSWNGSAGSYAGLTGLGVSVGVLDQGGLPTDHPAFWSMGACGDLSPSSRITANATPLSDHAAHVAGLLAGSGADSPALFGPGWSLRGVAPCASLALVVAKDNESCANEQALVEHAADLTNNSYGVSLYNAVSFAADNDAIVRGNATFDAACGGATGADVPARLSVWGAGNNGTSVEKGAIEDCGYWSVLNPQKNGIVVGGSLVDPAASPIAASERWDGSSIGPTLDGRLKPDVVAPACKRSTPSTDPYFRTANGSSSPYNLQYSYEPAMPCGTSYSAAFVTGVTALLLEEWRKVHGTLQPYPSTLKAALIQGAVDVVGNSGGPYSTTDPGVRLVVEATAGPDFATGYGEVSAEASAAVVAEQRLIEDAFLREGDSESYVLTVPGGAPRLRVTLAWDDRKPSQLDPAARKLENDLDLELYGPLESSPTVNKPWVLPTLVGPVAGLREPVQEPAGLAAATTGVDTVNNVEQVEIASPGSGTWEVRVKASELPDQDRQTFSLAADFAMTPAGPPTETFDHIGRFAVTQPGPVSRMATASVLGLLDRTTIIPARSFCRVPGECPPCARFGVCPPVRLDFEGMPEGWSVRLVDRLGKRISTRVTRDTSRASVVWPRDKERGAFIVLVPPGHALATPVPSKTRLTVTAGPAR